MTIPLRLWHLLALQVVLLASLVWAADLRIVQYTELTAPHAGDWLEIVDVSVTTDDPTGSSRKIRVDRLSEQIYALGTDYTNSSTTGTEITGIGPMTVPAAGTYKLSCFLIAQSAATGTGVQFGVNYTGTVTEMANALVFPDSGSAASVGTADGTVTGAGNELIVAHGSSLTESTTAPNLSVITGVITANENFWLTIDSLMTVSDTGDIELWGASEVASSQITVQSGSYCGLRRIA